MKQLIFSFLMLGLGIASAASYDINIPNPVPSGERSLAAGQYKVEVHGDIAVFKKGKESVELPVSVEQAAQKYDTNRVNSSGSQLQEIWIGGTKIKLVIKPGAARVLAGGAK